MYGVSEQGNLEPVIVLCVHAAGCELCARQAVYSVVFSGTVAGSVCRMKGDPHVCGLRGDLGVRIQHSCAQYPCLHSPGDLWPRFELLVSYDCSSKHCCWVRAEKWTHSPWRAPSLGLSPLCGPHSTRWEAQRELSRELVVSRSQESPLWLWTPRAATPATEGGMYFSYNTRVMPPQLDRCSAELECSGTPWRTWGGPSRWFCMDFPGTKPGFM